MCGGARVAQGVVCTEIWVCEHLVFSGWVFGFLSTRLFYNLRNLHFSGGYVGFNTP